MPFRAGYSPERFPWTGDVGRGNWIAERLDGRWCDTGDGPRWNGPALGDLVPSGFETLVRVLHPFWRDRPVSGGWQGYLSLEAAYEAAGEWGDLPELLDEPVTWRETARAHGAALSPDARSFRILGFERYDQQPDGSEVGDDGWRYELPADGRLVARALAPVARVLSAHTATPDRGIAAVWDGYGGLVSAQGVAYISAVEPRAGMPAWAERIRQSLWSRGSAFRERRRSFGLPAALRAWLHPFLQQPPGSGLLSKEAASGPRLELPDRGYICFEAGIESFAEAGWSARAPWIPTDELSEHAQSPNLIWPEDRAWFLISEIDLDSTLVACSRACADALLAAPGVEAVEIDRDTPLWDPLPADG